MENLVNNFVTTLTVAIDSSQTTMLVAFQAPAAADFRVLVDAELMIVTNNGTLAWTVTRGAEGTTPSSHVAGAPVVAVLTSGGLDAWLASNAPVSGGIPGGSPGEVQYNNAGSFGGVTGSTWDGANLFFPASASANFAVPGDGSGGQIFLDPNQASISSPNSGVLALTNGILQLYSQTSTLQIQALGDWNLNGDSGTAGQVLTSNGPGTPPTWQ